MVGNLTSVLSPISAFTSALMPAISEAHSNGKKALTEYYMIEGIKWSYFFVFFFMAVLAAVGPNLIQLAGPEWEGALKYIPIQLFFGALWPLAWYVDTVFQGTDHAGYNTGVWYVEQGTRITLLILLLPPLQIWGRYLSYIPAIIAKNVVALYLIRKKIMAFRPYWIHTLLAPAAGAGITYLILWGIQSLVATTDPVVSILVFIGGFLVGLILYAGLTGFFGGWDENTLAEFKHGIGMVRITRGFFNPMQKAAAWGHAHSPWRNRFQVTLAQQAQAEADALTALRRK